LASRADVRILTAQSAWTPIPGVRVVPAFSITPPWRIGRVIDEIANDPPDWLVVQFNQFSYGRWGFNPFLPWTLRRLSTVAPETRIAWMAHEDFVPACSLKFTVMRQWQRWQFRQLGDLADCIFFSIDPWVDTYGSWFPNTPVHHFPIGSNMPRVEGSPAELRAQLGLTDVFVVGFFGTLRARHTHHFQAALDALHSRAERDGCPIAVLYVGPDGPLLRAELDKALPALRVIDAGRLPAEDVSRHLAVMDLHLTPFTDGVSTRRGSFMAGLQHGVATVATEGPLTDRILRAQHDRALLLASTRDPDAFAAAACALYDDPSRRAQLGRAGRTLYETSFAFDITVPSFFNTLTSTGRRARRNEAHALHAHR
jgi:glycosyltransferase involved in cell wall biosynthesis